MSRLERGDRPPTLSALTTLAPRLGVTVDYLQTGEVVPPEARRELRVADAELELRLGGDAAKAEAVLRQEVDEPVTEHALVARAQAGLGLIAARRGDYAAAARLFEAALARGHLPPELRPDVYESLADCYVTGGRPFVAVHLLERCLDEVRERALADVALQVRFGMCLAAAQSALGATDLARVALAEATEAARAPLAAQARTRVWWARAGRAWDAGDTESALMLMRRASGLLEAGEDALRLGRAHLAAGRLLNLDERYEEADPHLHEPEHERRAERHHEREEHDVGGRRAANREELRVPSEQVQERLRECETGGREQMCAPDCRDAQPRRRRRVREPDACDGHRGSIPRSRDAVAVPIASQWQSTRLSPAQRP